MALGCYLCDGGSFDDTSYLFTHRPPINRATLPKSIGMPSSAGGNDLQSEPTLGACITNWNALDGDDRNFSLVKKQYSFYVPHLSYLGGLLKL